MGGAAGSIPAVRTRLSNIMTTTLQVTAAEAGQRLDLFCVSKLPHLSRAALQKAIKDGQILLNGQTVKARQIVQSGNVVMVAIVEQPIAAQQLIMNTPVPLSIPILYEDRDVVVINKPPGISAHQERGPMIPTVAGWFAARYPASASVGEAFRPGIVHRLDKDTSGVMILARTPDALEFLQQQFKQHRVKKEYLALVFHVPGEAEGRITRPLARSVRNPMRRTVDPKGREAITEWKKEKKLTDKFALLRVFPLTGRPHQIRTHLHWLGFPIVGDSLYTFRRQRPPVGARRQMLHAEKLTVDLPLLGRRTFVAPLPEDMRKVIELLL